MSDFTAFGGSGGLIVVDPDSGQQHKAVAAAEFLRPAGLAVEPSGRVIVAYMQRPAGHGNVVQVDLDSGDHHLIVPDPDLFEPYGVALEASGDVIVSEPDESGLHSRIHRLLRSGIQHQLHDGPAGHIYGGLALDAGGRIVVATSMVHDPGQVVRFDASGQTLQTIAVGGNLGFPIDVALDHGGAILVADSNRRIVRIDPASGAQTVVSSGGSLESPTGLAIR